MAKKVKEGIIPQSSKGTQNWAAKAFLLENKFNRPKGPCRLKDDKLIQDKSITHILPWKKSKIKSGNTCKVLYMELLIHHFNKTAMINFFDDNDKGLYGIKTIFVNNEQIPLFDKGYIPSISGSKNNNTIQIKTLTKIWYITGFIEKKINDGLLFEFNQEKHDHMRKQMKRQYDKIKNIHITEIIECVNSKRKIIQNDDTSNKRQCTDSRMDIKDIHYTDTLYKISISNLLNIELFDL